MKIRIKGNSIRLRLTRPEVEFFGKNGYLEEKTEIGEGFTYALVSSEDHNSVTADFKSGTMTLYLPGEMAREWVCGNTVGYGGEMDLAKNKKLYLLIEKDFKCLDNTIEDQSDNYPNPLAKNE